MGPQEDITIIAERIDDGDFIRGKSRLPADASSDSAVSKDAAPHPVETAVRSLADGFYAKLHSHSAPDDTPAIRAALGDFISSLEQLLLDV